MAFRKISLACLLIIVLACTHASASVTMAGREGFRMGELRRASVAYREVMGRYPIDDSASTWFEKLVIEEFANLNQYATTPDGRLPCDQRGRVYIYEAPHGPEGDPADPESWPIIRSVGRDGVDDGGEGDDFDIRFGVNWGHWYKQRWPLASWMSALTAAVLVVMGCMSVRIRQLRWLWLIATGIAAFTLPHVADPQLMTTAQTAPKALERVALFGAALVLVGVGGLLLHPLLHVYRRCQGGHCLECGYDLRGNVSQRCPECGASLGAGDSPP